MAKKVFQPIVHGFSGDMRTKDKILLAIMFLVLVIATIALVLKLVQLAVGMLIIVFVLWVVMAIA